MKQNNQSKLECRIQSAGRRNLQAWLFCAMSLMVTFCTAYILMRPAITEEAETFCGREEHLHTEDCYGTVTVLTCEKSETENHTHSESCYSAVSVLCCNIPESEEHAHEEACYTEEEQLTCTLEEIEGHTHTDACYGEPEQVLVCEQGEHTHDRSCFSNPEADLETSDIWSRCTSSGTLTGNRAQDLVRIAETQLGNSESERNYIANEDGTLSGITRYGQWAGTPYGEWNAAFVSFCLNYAGISEESFPRYSEAAQWAAALQQRGLYTSASETVAEPGRLAFFDSDSDGSLDRVGIVASVTTAEDGSVTAIKAIEGDVQGLVARVSYSAADARVKGYGILTRSVNDIGNESATDTDTDANVDTDIEIGFESDDTAAAQQNAAVEERADTSSTAEQVSALLEALPDVTAFSAMKEEEQLSAAASAAAAYEAYCELTDEEAEAISQEALNRAISILTGATADSILLSADTETASENTSFDTAMDIYAGASFVTEITSAGQYRYFVITPTKTGEYTFFSQKISSQYDTYGYLYDSSRKQLAANDDGAGGGQFSIKYTLTAGQTYYYAAKLYNKTATAPNGFYVKLTAVVEPEWSVSDDGVLTVSAPQGMLSYTSASATPWYGERANISAIVVEEGTPNIGDYAFAQFSKVESVQLPDSLKGIGDYAFYSDALLTSIAIPDGVATIGKYAFGSCTKLTGVTLPDTVKTLGEYAFYRCTALEAADLSASLTAIPRYAFNGCSSLSEIEIPITVKTIGEYAFSGCSSLTEISLPESLTTIGDNAFSSTGVIEIVIPDSVTSMGKGVLAYCTSLTDATLPAGITAIPANTFWGCSALTEYEIPETVTSIGNYAFRECGFTEFTIPDTVTKLGYGVFYGCKQLESASLPEAITTIPEYTFRNCSALTDFEISDTVTSIGSNAFNGCLALPSIEIPESVTTIESYAFGDCDAMTEVTIPSSVTSIGTGCFNDCDALKSVNLGSGLTQIPEKAFYSCDALSECIIPGSVTAIGKNAFQDCGSLKTLDLSDGLTTIEKEAFKNCDGLTSVVLPATVTTLDANVFYDCDGLTQITLPDSIISMDTGVFYDCDSLTAVTLPSGLTTVPQKTFYSCDKLESVTLPDGITEIGQSAFSGCKALKTIAIPASVTTIGATAFSGDTALSNLSIDAENLSTVDATAFTSCKNLKTVTIGTNVDTVTTSLITALEKAAATELELSFSGPNTFTLESSLDNLVGIDMPAGLYYADELGQVYLLNEELHTAKLVYVPSGTTSYTAPTAVGMNGEYTVTEIGDRAFDGNKELTTVTIPATVTKIGDAAFRDCVKLTSFNGETSIEGARASLPGTVFGGFSLENTGLSSTEEVLPDGTTSKVSDGEDFDSSAVQINITTETGKYKDPLIENNTLLYYTGETAKTTISVSNPDSSAYPAGTIVRVYFKFDDSKGKLDYAPGSYTFVNSESGNSYPYTVGTTTVPNCYYVDIPRPEQGETISLSICSNYPSPTSGGGTEKIWCAILSEAEYAELGNGVKEPTQYQLLSWDTKADTFPVTKKVYTSSSPTLVGDGKKDGMAILDNLAYTISYNRSGDTLYVGKDYMKSINFIDTLTLPEGFIYSDAVLEALRNGKYRLEKMSPSYGYTYYAITTAGDVKICTVRASTTSLVGTGSINVAETEDGRIQLITKWTAYSASSSTEMSANSNTITYSNILVPQAQLAANQKYTFPNTVKAVEHFNYSADQIGTASAEKALSVAAATPSLSKRNSSLSGNAYCGESAPFTLTVSNSYALPCTILSTEDNEMANGYYIPPSGIQGLFAAAKDDEEVTLTIENATLCIPDDSVSVTGVDGNTYNTTIGDTWSGSAHSGTNKVNGASYSTASGTIVFNQKAGSNLITMMVDDVVAGTIGEGGTFNSVSEALTAYRYKITYNDRYKVSWKYNEGTLLYGGEKRTYVIQAALKDTFMLLTSDEEYSFQGKSLGVTLSRQNNLAQLSYGDSEKPKITKASASYTPYVDFTLTKNCSIDGEASGAAATVSDGSVVDYTVTFRHGGTASYNELPLVDHMAGSQALLVPVEENNTAAWAVSCEVYTGENGTQYYVLADEGTYSSVYVGGYLADRVVVSATAQGARDTLIYWYFDNITGTTSRTVDYKALVCPKKLGLDASSLSFSIGNETWLGDYQGHRLYATVGEIGGVVFTMDKSIVDETSETPLLVYGNLEEWDYTQYATASGYDYCGISEGETVVYRLRLQSQNEDASVTLWGGNEFTGDLWDYLPAVTDNAAWSKANVSICYHGFTAVSDTSNNAWSIVTNDIGEQIITWNPDFYLSFCGIGDIYVTVQFPKNTETNTLWDEYARTYGTTTLINTFKVLNVTDSVTHDLVVPAEVRLQKGVAFTGVRYYQSGNPGGYYSSRNNTDEMSRWYYGNNDYSYYFVQYYASLCNEGVTNLYLTELVDVLPRGFTYLELYTVSGNIVIKDSDDTITKMIASINTRTDINEDTGIQTVHFTFRDNPTAYASQTLAYDETLGMYYLKPGQAIAFAYYALSNTTENTDDAAKNSISMPYYDYNGGGVTVGNSTTTYNYNAEANDGGCELIDNGTAESIGLSGGNNSTQWLTSDVTLYRGNIRPGITKSCYSATSVGGTTTMAPAAAGPTDTITWRIVAQNSGFSSLQDFVITDVMEAPYTFTGAVGYELYEGTQKMLYNTDLFTITENTGTTATLKSYRSGTPVTTTVPINAEDYTWFPVRTTNVLINSGAIGGPTVDIGIRIYFDENGNQVMMLRFPDTKNAIPSGGRMELTYKTTNATNTAQNHTFVNDAYITPMRQTWDHTVTQGNYTTLDLSNEGSDLPSVKSSAQITVATGYATTSVKKIEEVGNETNSALSTSSKNYIFLEDNANLFTYTLTVNNTTTHGMDQLIIIDNLPESDDHSTFTLSDMRDSEFKVSLADNPSFTAIVTNQDGTETVLDPADYTIELSTKTEFSKQDWNGTETDGWVNLSSADARTVANARSVRMTLLDDAGTKIPAQASFALRFNAKIDDATAAPAEMAWNSFGYHYSLTEVSYSLEAAPRKVGILIPSEPSVQKNLQYETGTDFLAEENLTFRYILYSGALVDLSDAHTDAERYSKLVTAGRQIAYLERTVLKGESTSETLSLGKLPLTVYDTERGWQTVPESEFTFVSGSTYTLYEIPENPYFSFRNGSVNGASNVVRSSGFTFTYDVRTNQQLTVVNTRNTWKLTVTKTDERDNTLLLKNAVFGLYSPVKSDLLAGEAAGDYAKTKTEDSVTYYLCGIYTTDTSGRFTADQLLRDRYLLAELQAPENYDLNETAFTIERTADYSAVSLTVSDRLTQFELPMTGGTGTGHFAMLGSMLIASAAVLILYRRKKEVEASS